MLSTPIQMKPIPVKPISDAYDKLEQQHRSMTRESVPPELQIDSKVDIKPEPKMSIDEEETPLDFGEQAPKDVNDSPIQSPADGSPVKAHDEASEKEESDEEMASEHQDLAEEESEKQPAAVEEESKFRFAQESASSYSGSLEEDELENEGEDGHSIVHYNPRAKQSVVKVAKDLSEDGSELDPNVESDVDDEEQEEEDSEDPKRSMQGDQPEFIPEGQDHGSVFLKPDEAKEQSSESEQNESEEQSEANGQTLSEMEQELKECTSKLQVYLVKQKIREKKQELGLEIRPSDHAKSLSDEEEEPSEEAQDEQSEEGKDDVSDEEESSEEAIKEMSISLSGSEPSEVADPEPQQ